MLSLEQKLEIRKLYQSGCSTTQISEKLNINIHTVRKWVRLIKKKVFVFYDGSP